MLHGKIPRAFTLTGVIGAAGIGLLLLSSVSLRAQASDEEVVAQGEKKKQFRESGREDPSKDDKAQAELIRLRQELEQMRAELEKRAEELLKAAETLRRMQEKKGREQANPPQGFPLSPSGSAGPPPGGTPFGSPGGPPAPGGPFFGPPGGPGGGPPGSFGGFGGFGGFGVPGGNALDKRLRDIEAKLDRILKEMRLHERMPQGKGYKKHQGDEQCCEQAEEAKTDASKKLPGVVDAPVRPVYYFYPPARPYSSPYASPRPSFLPQPPQPPRPPSPYYQPY